jgi:preprotein translocase subunit Sss1
MDKLVMMSKFYIEGIGIMSIGIVGLVINAFALYILFRKQV